MSTEDAWRPTSEPERQHVRDQLMRLLASPYFLTSRRYPNMLRFVVEQALAGHEDALKERLLGIEVFHRAPDYDTNQDPVVRLSAAEVRKRLALSYRDPEHERELVIGLNPGSYIPVFRTPKVAEASIEATSIKATPVAGATENGKNVRYWSLAAEITVGVLLATSFGLYRLYRPSVIDQFWSPVFDSPSRVTMCVGSPNTVIGSPQVSAIPDTVGEELLHSARLSIPNVVTLIHIGSALADRHKNFRLTEASQANFPELREGPVVLVGAIDNIWTMRLTQRLRYGFAMNADAMYIVDRKNPAWRDWTVSLKQSSSSQSKDFAIIARYRDAMLDQPVVVAAGLSRQGTEAAGELMADPSLVRSLFGKTSRDWKTVNLEAVVETQVIDGHFGASHILAVNYW